ncbi:Ger(x)C family spore germination protein [Sporomusa paucivorans]|uniref:Ger(x)C family spore germination protein n=1 Tax=Sporomusa TaxID=2375 RepID=UPI0035715A5C
MKVRRRLAGMLLILTIAALTGGCWDRREIQDRNFVLAVAIDTADAGQQTEQEKAEAKAETFVQPRGDKRYRVSLQILKLIKNGGNRQNGGDNRTYVLSNTGQSIFEIVRDMLGQTSKSLFFEHIQAVVISEAVLRETGITPIIDFFLRDAEMRWRIKVYVTPGEARPILEYAPPSKEAGGIYLANIVRNHTKNLHVAGARTDLGNISIMLDSKSDLIIPRLDMAGNVVKAKGAAVFKKHNFVGYVDERAVAGLKMIRATEKSAIITLPGEEAGELLAVEVFRHDTRLTPHVDGDNVYFTLDITMWGNLGEHQLPHRTVKANDPAFIRRVERQAAEEVKSTVLYSKNVCQSLGVDVLNFGNKLKRYKPKDWNAIKDDWEEIYPNVPLVVSVNVVINQLGEHK